MLISQGAFNLIVNKETGGQARYEARYLHPDWPGGASGVTIGVGYDCGYATASQIQLDWGTIIPGEMVHALIGVCGIKGSPAHSHALELHSVVTVPWAAALSVFANIDVPRWTQNVQRSLKNTDKLSPDSLGALVSLAFNRGCSFTLPGSRYNEMRDIAEHMENQQFALIPQDIRSMERLWPNCEGLVERRKDEAALFEKGLNA